MLPDKQDYVAMSHQDNELFESDSESESEVEDEGCDVEDAVLVVHSSVDCLMGLLPSMERSFLAANIQGGRMFY